MSFVLKRIDQRGGYVAKTGNPSSYVHDLRLARKFPSIEDAMRQRCENEEIMDLESLLDGARR